MKKLLLILLFPILINSAKEKVIKVVDGCNLYAQVDKLTSDELGLELFSLLGNKAFNSKDEAKLNNIYFDKNNSFERKEIVIIPNYYDNTYVVGSIVAFVETPIQAIENGISYQFGWLTQGLYESGVVYPGHAIGKIPYHVLQKLLPEPEYVLID